MQVKTKLPVPAAIDRYLLFAGRSAANPPAAAAVVDRWDRRTDRMMDTMPLHKPSRMLCEQCQ